MPGVSFARVEIAGKPCDADCLAFCDGLDETRSISSLLKNVGAGAFTNARRFHRGVSSPCNRRPGVFGYGAGDLLS